MCYDSKPNQNHQRAPPDGVGTAMYQYGELLNSKTFGSELQKAALKIAHACREELAKSWKV
jgi:hypothetical protein